MGESFTIDEWCRARRMSRAMFYQLQARGDAPRTYRVGRQQRISPAADAEWVAKREAASVAEVA
jgi:predicted DNA-binding transcriptional regulator AlpA